MIPEIIEPRLSPSFGGLGQMPFPDCRETPAGLHPDPLFLWEKLLSQFPPFGPHVSSSSCCVTAVPGAVGPAALKGEQEQSAITRQAGAVPSPRLEQ